MTTNASSSCGCSTMTGIVLFLILPTICLRNACNSTECLFFSCSPKYFSSYSDSEARADSMEAYQKRSAQPESPRPYSFSSSDFFRSIKSFFTDPNVEVSAAYCPFCNEYVVSSIYPLSLAESAIRFLFVPQLFQAASLHCLFTSIPKTLFATAAFADSS